MQQDDINKKGKNLDQELAKSSSAWADYINSPSEVSKWTILNKILFILGDDQANVVFADHREGEDEGTGTIVVFTDTYLLYGEGELNSLSFKLVPRCNLETLDLNAATRVASWGDGENGTRVRLGYKHGIRISLPPGEKATNKALAEVDSLVPHLIKELVANAS
jgi:hypothetical protein